MAALVVAIDDIFRLAIVIATALSFYPQLRKIVSRGDADGISLTYLLLSAVSAMEQFTLYASRFIYHEDFPDSEVSTPRTVGDWLNLIQVSVLLLSTTILVAFATWYPPNRQSEKVLVTLGYLAFAYGSFLPVLPHFSKSYREHSQWGLDMFFATHSYAVNWLVTMGVFPFSLFCQWLLMLDQPVPQSLSVDGLAAQAVVFILTGISWTWRMTTDKPTWVEWYEYVGYAAVDNLLFGIVQAVLYLFVLEAIGLAESPADAGETSPLLPN